MEARLLTIFLCALFVFSAEGAPKFTKTPQNSFLALEGDNITLEWRYTFVDEESFLSALLRKDGGKVVNKHFYLSKPIIQRPYRGRLHANMTDDYALITLLGVNRLDKGSYTLEVTSLPDEEGNVSAVEISVLYMPGITAHPQNVTKKEGDNATLICNAMGNPVPKISWNKGGLPLSNNSRVSLSMDNKQMTITNMKRADSGQYGCVATNSLGNDTSNPAYLGVQYNPEISPLPRMIQRIEGKELTIFCNATGNPLPTISWTIDGNSLDTSNSSGMDLSYEGKQLTIKNVNRGDNGVYRCVAENSLGNVTSNGTTLEVLYIPGVVMIGGPQQFAIVGKIRKLICEYDAVPSVSEVQWIKDGDVIARNFSVLVNESRLTVSHYNESQIQLLINQSTSHDAGDYTCLVINAVGNSSQKTSIISQELPLITIHSEGKTPMERENMTLSCNATGNPEPSISWVKDGFPISSNSRISFSHDNKRLTITYVNRMDSGEYRCVATNRVGNDTSNSKVNVLFEPEVTIDGDHEQYMAKGSNIRLICRYEASPPVSEVQWIKEGTVIAENTSMHINDSRVTIPSFNESQIQLSITAASLKDGGNYTCKVTNILNSTQDMTVIIIEDKPEITTHPQNITTREGQNVTLYCNATGNPAPTISWYKNGHPINNSFSTIFSPSYEQLTIRNVNRIDRGDYTCQAKNRVGTDTSNTSTINVQYRPEITKHPQNVTVTERNNVTLTCNATGNPEPQFSWYKVENTVKRNNRINVSAGNSHLTITDVNREDSGGYLCVAHNEVGNDTSIIVILDVQYKPDIATHPHNIRTREGQNVTLYCNATGNPALTISWYKNGYPISNDSSIILSPGHEQLTIRNVKRKDSGNYTCRANNSVGTDTSNASTINVQFRAEIVSHPQANVTKEEGSNLTLFCNATGNPTPIILWTKDGSSISNNSRISFSIPGRLLIISNVNRTDSGHYRCVANNSLGNDTSNVTTVDIQYKPGITTHPESVAVKEGKNVNFSCNATANPSPRTSWFKDESPITNKSRISLSVDNKVLTITNVSRKDSGKYRCVASNKLGNDTSKAAELNVKYRPEITKHPQNVTETERNNVTLTCNATGNPEPQFSWYKVKNTVKRSNRINFSANNSLLTITDVNRKDSGGYLCVAHNQLGNDTSIIVILDVQYKPDIATHPQNITTREGQNVTLYCNATGNPAPTIAWNKNGYPINNSFSTILSPSHEQLTIRNVNRIDSGDDYTCQAKNIVGTDTTNASTINVQFRAEIVSHPQANVTKEEGNKLTLFCNATGNPTPIILWTKDGSPLNNNSRIRFSIHNRLLTLSNVNRTDNGHYRCVANNSLGNDTSNVATVDIQYKPEITSHPKNVDIKEGGNVTFSCNSTANPLPTTSWTKDESAITSNSRISFSVVNRVLTITNVNRKDRGEYRCVASNKLGNDTSQAAKLNVKYEPEIITDPSNDTVKEGQNTTFYCNATGNPLPVISWKKDGHSIGNNSRISYSAKSNELRIINVNRTDRGKYHCVANNSIGNASSHAATLAVEYKSEITTHPSNVTKTEGENVTLHCNATGYPLPTLSWTKDGSDIGNNSRISFSADKKKLAITKASRVDSGAYRCVANNSLGNDTSMAAVVDVQYVPDPPKDVKVISRASREVNVSWTAGSNGNSAIQNYTVEIKEDKQTFRDAICQGTLLKNNCVIYSTRVSIKELLPWTTYYLRVSARNMIGSSHYSSVINVTTEEEEPRSAPPFNVTVLNSTAVNVSWQMLTKEDARGDILGYYILYKRKSEPEVPWKNRTVNRMDITFLVLASLDKYTPYQFAIQAFNSKGVSRRSEIEERNTDEDVPSEAPEWISAATKNSTSIELAWKPVPERNLNGYLTNYVIRYHKVIRYTDGEEEIQRKVGRYREKVVINGLRASTTYSFNISAATDKGEGPRSKPTEAKTKDPPTPPDPDDVGTNEVSVAFKPWQILSNGDKVSYYQIIVVPLKEGKDPGKPSDKEYVNVIKRYEDKSEGEPYITAEFSNDNKQRKTFPVGDEKYYSRGRGSGVVARRKRIEVYTKYFNGKLDDDTEYAVFQRSLSENGSYQDEGFSQFTTKTLPREEEPTPGKKNKHLIVVGVFIGLFIVCVVVVGGIVIVWLRGRRQNNANDDGEEISLEEQGYENFDPEGEIAVEEFEDHVKRLQEDDLFSVEYGAIRSQGNVTSKATLAEENKHKNRYNNIVAYDHSRVKLTPIEGVRGSDYINANFLDGYQKDKAYIATQGPLEHTSDDFWRMVWEQGTKTIVMVTNLEEKGRLKCHQYWPSEGAESYGDIRVTLMQTVQLTEFTIRTMTLKHANNTEQRTVNQYHYTVWPDHGVPDCPSSLLTFVRKASRANPPDAGPMVVHCSAGVGRTGTFIVVDAMLRRIAAEKTVDVYEYVTSLRQDRNFMVQVEEQYILIHDVLVEAIHSGFTEIHANDLRSHIKNLMQVNQTSGQSEMDEEFIRLGRCINTSQLTAQAASMACNVTKNRYPNALPYDETRVKLSVISGVEGSDYINANFIDGYMTRRAFIATQAPIPDTIPDFWRMIWEQESSTIVVLSKETEGDKVKVHQYWPAEKPAHIGTLVVEKTSETSYEDYTMREMKLTHTKESASRVVRQYHYTGWPDSGSPESGTGLIDLIGQVQRWQQQSENTKITVHCSAGVGRTGVFCALSILIGQLKSEGVVDVFQTVKQLRVERPAMVQTKDQYEFIYSALSEYLDSFDAYSNF